MISIKADLVKQIPELVAPSSATVSKPSTADINPIQKDAKITNAISQTDSDRTVVVAFEACKSCHRFAKKAREIYAELCELLPAASGVRLELSINGDDGNEMKVRRGSFEISVYEKMADGEAKRKEIWTGLKKGPPRINKYPETKNVLDDILSLYN